MTNVILTYNTDRYDFLGPVEAAIGDPHKLRWDGGDIEADSDQQTPWHRKLYTLYEHGWLDVWRRFAAEWIRPLFGPGYAYQARPTWRVHPAGNRAIGPWHTDTRYGHGSGTTNLWIPLTTTNEQNTLWVAGEPRYLAYGEVLVFDGVHLEHGNIPNVSDVARVSFDARVAPLAYLGGGTSYNTRTPLVVGGYYETLDSSSGCWARNSDDGSTRHSAANNASSFTD